MLNAAEGANDRARRIRKERLAKVALLVHIVILHVAAHGDVAVKPFAQRQVVDVPLQRVLHSRAVVAELAVEQDHSAEAVGRSQESGVRSGRVGEW